VPNVLTIQWGERNTAVQGITLDFLRFNSENILDCYTLEYDAIKREMPEAVVTTNLMGAYRQLDYRKWAKRMDIVSWDNYPRFGQDPASVGFSHDLMRGLKDGDPFLLMEQTPSRTNWQDYNALKRPGVMRLQSYQAIAHGADSVLFFQMRASVGACEKFHGAVIDHSGRNDTRVFREVSQLGSELSMLGDKLIGSRIDADVAIWFDWECYWASENSMGPSISYNYVEEVQKYYAAFHSLGIATDIAGPDTDISGYKVVVAPAMYLLHPGTAQKIDAFVRQGGYFVATFMSGVADENDRVFKGGAPGPLKDILGLRVEETDALPPDRRNTIIMKSGLAGFSENFECNLLFDLVQLEGAESLAEYGKEFYAGRSVFTEHAYGKGKAFYISSSPDARFSRSLASFLCAEQGVCAPAPIRAVPEGVEVTRRSHKDGRSFLFLLNHAQSTVNVNIGAGKYKDLLSGKTLSGNCTLAPTEVLILVEI
jgi:beta-galactosidase